MALAATFQAAFVAGALDNTLAARSDTSAYALGQEELINCIVLPQGPVERRWGTVYRAEAGETDQVKLVPFTFNDVEAYMVWFTPDHITIFTAAGNFDTNLDSPYLEDELNQLRFVQFSDLMLMFHPDYPLKALRRLESSWDIVDYTFSGDQQYLQAYYRFVDNITLDASGTTGTITITASASFWINSNPSDPTQTHIGKLFRIKTGYCKITAVSSDTVATATVLAALPDHVATDDWAEQAWSPMRGYPRSGCLHQGRLVVGGSRDVPDQIWGSKVDYLGWFATGTNAADAWSVSTNTGTIGVIQHMRSGPGGIEVFKSTGEGLLPSGKNDPITPASVAHIAQTSYGCTDAIPVVIDDASVFVQRAGGSLREFRFVDVNQRYGADSLIIRSASLLNSPVNLGVILDAFGRKADFLFAVNADGSVAVMTTAVSQDVRAWSLWRTDGQVLDVSSANGYLWWAVKRGNRVHMEIFNQDARCDSGDGDTSTPGDSGSFEGFDAWVGRTVDVVSAGEFVGQYLVPSTGLIPNDGLLDHAEIGFPFRMSLKSMPLDTGGDKFIGRKKRIIRCTVRVKNSSAITVNGQFLRIPSSGGTGDFEARFLGWQDDPRIEIAQIGPSYMMVLGYGLDVAVN